MGDYTLSECLSDSMWLLVLLFMSAFFSGAETSITAVNRGKLEVMQEKRPFLKGVLKWLIDDVQEALTVCLISNNVVNIAASTFASAIALKLFSARAIIWVVPIMTVMVVIFGEILPKSIAMIYSENVLTGTLPLLRLLAIILMPFAWTMKKCVSMIGLLLHMRLDTHEVFVTRDEIEQFVLMGEESGAIEASERRMINGIIDFDETRVHEIMVPRMDMLSLEASDTLLEAMKLFIEHGHSRIPVYEDTLDDIVGILYVKDTLSHLLDSDLQCTVGSLVRKPIFVPETIHTAELLEVMRREHIHIAIVMDEYGGVAGLVTMEDILEEIVGEIQDEYDQEAPEIQKQEDGSYLVQGSTGLEDLSEALGCTFEAEDAESLAGLVLTLSGDFPKEGDVFEYCAESEDEPIMWDIRVIDLEDHRVKLLSLKQK